MVYNNGISTLLNHTTEVPNNMALTTNLLIITSVTHDSCTRCRDEFSYETLK